jgi:hypothetical protein
MAIIPGLAYACVQEGNRNSHCNESRLSRQVRLGQKLAAFFSTSVMTQAAFFELPRN